MQSHARESNAKRGLRRLSFVIAPAAVLIGMLAASCGTNEPGMAAGGALPQETSACLTPTEGCPCSSPDAVVDCGKVEERSGDYVLCSTGSRRCVAGAWGACSSESLTTKYVPLDGAGAIHTRALGSSQPCPATGPLSNPCDPYCTQMVDDPSGLVPEGGLTVTDAGLTIASDAGLDASAPGVFVSQPGGAVACTGANDAIVSGACSGAPGPLVNCQQDHHCDPTVNRCLWNAGPGYQDPAAGGPDLTVNAPCGPGGGVSAMVSVCNRGTAAVPAGADIVLQRTAGPSPPNGCAVITGALDSWTFALTASLDPGACVAFDVPDATTGNGFITVNAGPGGAPVAEGPGRCANNSAAWRTDGPAGCGACTTCNTRITGRVYDPSGASPTANANNIGLANVLVYQPASTLVPFVDGVACDTCASLSSPVQTQTVTAVDGTFTLDNVSPGAAVPIVVQSGRWRRRVNVNVSNVCGVNGAPAIPNGTFRMPRNATEGDIPKIAIVKTHKEAMECWLRKVGIDASEFAPRTAAGPNVRRFQTWDAKSDGQSNTGGMNPVSMRANAAGGLYTTDATINEYSAIIWGCDNNNNNTGGPTAGPHPNNWTDTDRTSAADRARIAAWANAGGRIFMNHRVGVNLLRNVPGFTAAANWAPAPCNELYSCGPSQVNRNNFLRGWVVTPGGPQATMRQWLINNGVSVVQGPGFMDVPDSWAFAYSANAPAIEWVRGTNGAGPGHHNLTLSFETPFGAPNTCGRVIYNGLHTSAGRASNLTGTFPTACTNGALTDAELALEYQFFQLTACSITPPVPPPPPPPPPLPVVYYTRDYEAACAAGHVPVWQYFRWRSIIPPTTSIEFHAATADTQAGLPPSPPTSPATTRVGTAATTTPGGTFAFDVGPPPAGTVDFHLRNDTPGPQTSSKRWLRIYMVFRPTGQIAPTLQEWAQQYDCVPSE
ncbi:MAG: hypothetical protein KF850_33540 [Labilithrix sp.]|nr:hypothetical protein [Labilithrix sp.]